MRGRYSGVFEGVVVDNLKYSKKSSSSYSSCAPSVETRTKRPTDAEPYRRSDKHKVKRPKDGGGGGDFGDLGSSGLL